MMLPWEATGGILRTPVHDTYDAHVGLLPVKGAATHAFALVKRVYSFDAGTCVPAESEALDLGPLSSSKPAPLPLGADFWPRKAATDVVVRGAACAPTGSLASRMLVTIRVGIAEKRIAVAGRRVISSAGSGVRVSAPDSVTEIPLDARHAYGGLDPRVSIDPAHGFTLGDVQMSPDHPGAYPRNLWGKGYVIGQPPDQDVEMPNLEDPDDLLSEGRIIVGEPSAWYAQPLPWHADWTVLSDFPRRLRLLGGDAWYPGPEDERMVEVRRGYLPNGYRSKIGQLVDPGIAQEATYGLVLHGLRGGEAVSLAGVDPDVSELCFSLPAPPRMELVCEGAREAESSRIHSVVFRPRERKVVLVFGAELSLPRTFVPGIHKRIPVSLCVDGGEPIWFETPPTLRERSQHG